jgi:hypothetical protein
MQEINNTEFFEKSFGRTLNIKLNGNSSYEYRVVPYVRRDMTKLTVAYRILQTLLRTSRESGMYPKAYCQTHT